MGVHPALLLLAVGFAVAGAIVLLFAIPVKWSPLRFRRRVRLGVALMLVTAVILLIDMATFLASPS